MGQGDQTKDRAGGDEIGFHRKRSRTEVQVQRRRFYETLLSSSRLSVDHLVFHRHFPCRTGEVQKQVNDEKKIDWAEVAVKNLFRHDNLICA